jgi:hypothetical protein
VHPPGQQDVLKGLLAELGYCDAVLARELADGQLQLIDGHLRCETTPDMAVPVLVLDVTEAEADKLLLTLDPLAGLAQANREALVSLLANVDSDSAAVQAMLADLAAGEITPFFDPEPGPGLTDPDDIPLPPDTATTQPGDLWQLGRHFLKCGDSANPQDLDHLVAGARIQLVNTDPPYGVRCEPRSNNAIAAGLSSFQGPKHHQRFDVERHPQKARPTEKKLRPKDRPLANDFVSEEEFNRLLQRWFSNLARILQPGGSFYIWGGYANLGNYPPVLKACDLYFSQAIVWNNGQTS